MHRLLPLDVLTIWCRKSTIDDTQCDDETNESPLQKSAKNMQSNDGYLILRSYADYTAYLPPAPKYVSSPAIRNVGLINEITVNEFIGNYTGINKAIDINVGYPAMCISKLVDNNDQQHNCFKILFTNK